MLKRILDPWYLAIVVSAITGLLLSLLGEGNGNLLRAGDVILKTGPATFFACSLAERYFDVLRSRLLRWVMIGAFTLLTATLILEIIDPGLFVSLIVLQVMLLIAEQIGLAAACIGLTFPMAANSLRVPSGRIRGYTAIAMALLMAATPFVEWPVGIACVGLVVVGRLVTSY
ncbi:MAG: hypothetical protein IPF59_03955 [Ignavibacteria bacterium]|nr:hypothetical protein [Ignavibacteria bacterium]